MSKAEFLAGTVFIGPLGTTEVLFYFRHDTIVQVRYKEHRFHACVVKVTDNFVHIFSSLMQKTVKASISLASLVVADNQDLEGGTND
jgi:hypothetical protein